MNRLLPIVLSIFALMLCGASGYVFLEGWSWGDGLYMTVITLSTVGYTEVAELSGRGRAFTGVLVLSSLVVMTYWTASLTSYIVEFDLSGTFFKRRMLRMISKLSGHVIVCGTEPVADALIERLVRKRVSVVVVDTNAKRLEEIRSRFRKVLVLEGNPTSEITLAEANILSARIVIAAMASEVDNLLIGITSRDLGQEISVFALSNDPILGNRMRKIGIDEVINPAELLGDHVAALVSRNTAAAPKEMAAAT